MPACFVAFLHLSLSLTQKAPVRGFLMGALAIPLAGPVLAAGAGGEAPVVFLDGRAVIAEADIRDYQATQACYGEDAIASRQAALMRLLETAIAQAAMLDHKGPILTDADLAEDALRIEKETRAPEILACIKNHFGNDTRRYERVFVRPALVETRLRYFLSRDAGVQSVPRRKLRLAAEKCGKGLSLQAGAREFGLDYSSATYLLAATPSTAPQEPSRHSPPADYQAEFIRLYLAGLKPGQLRREPVETDYDLRLVRLIRADGSEWSFESAGVPKTTQEDWFRSLPKMKLAIRDGELLRWIRGIRGNPRLAAVSIIPAPAQR